MPVAVRPDPASAGRPAQYPGRPAKAVFGDCFFLLSGLLLVARLIFRPLVLLVARIVRHGTLLLWPRFGTNFLRPTISCRPHPKRFVRSSISRKQVLLLPTNDASVVNPTRSTPAEHLPITALWGSRLVRTPWHRPYLRIGPRTSNFRQLTLAQTRRPSTPCHLSQRAPDRSLRP